MTANVEKLIRVTLDTEIKAPCAGYPSLPDVVCFIVLFGPQRRMAEVMNEKIELFLEGILDGSRCRPKVPPELVSPSSPHHGLGVLESEPAHVRT